ncbi:copper amine oxidase N-terminal domain-containing protein [Fredinandcohnia sp. QZ13]|uniref:copper amine oxidase N-terminal domain-containing protein n=1 Tax=Fredinandcohnia sp. QZ13 TaxID=3073144 RepID=UPI0028535780|nr:copper amine oxidase N-terminal domain-containing protein [Fredinandcohnia sp. QZ13]MDR4887790.1 copper amine oxidase N-terminal domain-containing protein [Fredinandcohnia sp. QZ13]
MKTRKFTWILSVVLLLFIFQSVNIVKADDDDYERDEHGRYERYEKDDDDHEEWEEEEEYENRYYIQENQIQPSYWNIWTRDTIASLTDTLPFQEPKEVTVELNGKSGRFYIVPMEGQLLISGEKMAKFFGAEYTFYQESRIFEASTNQVELIVRAGSNVVYENMVKTPMPTKAQYFEKSVFLPVSVMANAFGYRVNWDEANGNITMTKMM